MEKEIIKTDKAPAAIGTYSQAIKVKATTLTFVSGQIPIDPASGELIGGGALVNRLIRLLSIFELSLRSPEGACLIVSKLTLISQI